MAGLRLDSVTDGGPAQGRRGSYEYTAAAAAGAPADAQLTVSGPKAALVGVVLQPGAAAKLAAAGQVALDGDATVLTTLATVMDEFQLDFPIVTP